MQDHEMKAIHAAHTLLASLVGAQATAMIGQPYEYDPRATLAGQAGQQAKQSSGGQSEPPRQPELDRELARLTRATEMLREACSALWQAAGPVVIPMSSAAGSDQNEASCGSPIGGVIRERTMDIERQVSSLLELRASLATN